jgi:hypothetical protein
VGAETKAVNPFWGFVYAHYKKLKFFEDPEEGA